MAINKTINKRTNSHGAMRNCIEYVLRQDKTSELLTYVTGPYCHDEINYDLVYRTFLEEKKMWDKDSGRMYAHNIISWHKDEQITPEQALEFGKEFAENWFSGFQTLVAVHKDKDHIHCHLVIPQEEVIVEATRKSVVSFPEIAIRELLANAMIHQDLQQRGTNPMVEVFKNRIEFSNAGAPLVAIERIVDSVPVSRNENIAGFMHKCGICEERGSGYDKIVEATGKNELLAPRIENQNNQFTKAILFAKVPFELTTKEDRMRTCYMQACLAYVNFEGISNSDIRKIFGLGEKEKAKASRLLTSAVDGGYIKVMDPDTAPRYKKYIPYWA